MATHRGTHSDIFLHFVWGTKNRLPLIDEEIMDNIREVFVSKANELEIKILEMNGTTDHIHVLIRSIPSISPSDIVKHLKGCSSHFVNHVTKAESPEAMLYWQDGFGVFSVSPSDIDRIRMYIRRQKTHHDDADIAVD